MSVEERVLSLEKAFVQLTQLAISASERADTHERWINALGANAEALGARMEALAARMEELAAAQANSEVKIAALTDAQIRTEEAIAKTNETMAALTSRVDHLSELVERIISENRNSNS